MTTIAAAVAAAAPRLLGRVVATPLVPSPWLSALAGREVRLKLENVQHTGSFKYRGALHALLRLEPARRLAGVVAASSGNHGAALAAAGRELAVPVTVFVPSTAPAARRDAIAALGAAVHVHGDDCVHTEAHARAVAAAAGQAYVSPYNDADVVAGQGTVAVELLQQWPEVGTIYTTLGGGGLTAGVAAYTKAHAPGIEVVACSPGASPAMAQCVRAGRIVAVPCGPTLSDSTAGGVEPGAITFAPCREFVDRFVDVGEPAIAAAVLSLLEHQHLLAEGAAGVAVAGCLADGAARDRPAAIVVCGGNLPLATLRALLAARG